MAFIQLNRNDSTSDAYLVNTEHIVSVVLAPTIGGVGGYTHSITLNAVGNPQFIANFTSLESARAAYDSLNNYLNPDATAINLY